MEKIKWTNFAKILIFCFFILQMSSIVVAQESETTVVNSGVDISPTVPGGSDNEEVVQDGDVVFDETTETTIHTGDSTGIFNPRDADKGFLEVEEDGAYIYETMDEDNSTEVGDYIAPKPDPSQYENGLTGVSSTGAYIYKYDETEESSAINVQLGFVSPPSISNSVGLTYEDIYSDDYLNSLFVEYQWPLFTETRQLTLGVGTGFATTSANGRFVDDPLGPAALEEFMFIALLNSVSLDYRFQYSSTQVAAPFLGAALLPILVVEHRDDDLKTAYDFAPAGAVYGGLKFNLTSLDSEGLYIMDTEYGINRVWLNLEAKLIFGLNSDVDFSSQMYSVGFGFDY